MPTFQKRGDSWRAIIRRKGFPALSDTFPTKLKAVQWARQVEAQMDQGAGGTFDRTTTCEQLLRRYLEEVTEHKKDWRAETIRINRLLKLAWVKRPASDCDDQIATWVNKRSKEVGGGTVNREMNVISGVFTHAIKVWRVKLPFNPISRVKRPKKPEHRWRRVSAGERAALWKKFGTSPPKQVQQYIPFLFEIACETGLRVGELIRLQWCDLDYEGHTIFVRPFKLDRRGRHALMTERAEQLLKEIPQVHQDLVFPVNQGSIDTMFRTALGELGIEGLHFHDSRHEACSQLAKRLSIQELAAVIGHKNIKTLMIYYNPTPQELAQKLRGAPQSKPPRP